MDAGNFRHLGIKLTPQRLVIFNFLSGNKSHPSADEIYQGVKEEFPTMSFATVYNTLEALRKRGMIQELTIEPGRKRYDPDVTPHHHLICVNCFHIVDIFKEFRLSLKGKEARNFDIRRTQIEFYGLCQKCKKETEKGHIQ
jgi:Fur family peroxide stress response transcriptional regulator